VADPQVTSPSLAAPSLPDDREEVQAGDRLLLVIEDDAKFAKIVYDYAHKKNFKCIVAGDGETGLKLTQSYKADAIILDLNLPGMSGWEVLDALKHNADTLHIPVHIMSVADEDLDAYKRGAMGFLTKPTSPEDLEGVFEKIEEFIARKIKSLLLVEDDTNLRKSVRKLLEGSDVTISEASLGQAALEQLATQHFDCMILDLSLPDMSGFDLLNRMDGDETVPKCPVIVYTGKALTEEENHELLKYADSVIVKGAKSPERLLDETALFLHRVIAEMPEEKQRTLRRLLGGEGVLAGKEILIVDDDARNAFALSKLLADKGLKVHIAANGQKALELLDKTAMDLVLMDIMLPGMDGYEVTRRIRGQARFQSLPILALTAKAMKGDREKCIAAGANDYLSKPVDADRLFSMLRVWLSKE
jgi:CheY-like chemotaxis protein